TSAWSPLTRGPHHSRTKGGSARRAAGPNAGAPSPQRHADRVDVAADHVPRAFHLHPVAGADGHLRRREHAGVRARLDEQESLTVARRGLDEADGAIDE